MTRDTMRNSVCMHACECKRRRQRASALNALQRGRRLARSSAAVRLGELRVGACRTRPRHRRGDNVFDPVALNSRSIARAARGKLAPSPAGSAKAASVASTGTSPHSASASIGQTARTETRWVATAAATRIDRLECVRRSAPMRCQAGPAAAAEPGRADVGEETDRRPRASRTGNGRPATRCEPCTDKPTPPPITMPSTSAT